MGFPSKKRPNPIFTCNEPPLYLKTLFENPALPLLGKNPPYLETLKTFLLRTSHLTNPPYGSPTANSYRLSSDLLQQFVIIIITLKTHYHHHSHSSICPDSCPPFRNFEDLIIMVWLNKVCTFWRKEQTQPNESFRRFVEPTYNHQHEGSSLFSSKLRDSAIE